MSAPYHNISRFALHAMFRDPSLRNGQALMVGLHEADPDLSNIIAGTDADPFYDNGRIDLFWAAIHNYYTTGSI